MDYSKIRDLLLHPLDDVELVRRVKILSENFTVKREKIGEYVLDEKQVSAYAGFYLPTNLPKLKFLLDQLPLKVREQISNCHIIDFGTGPGTYALGFCDYFKKLPEIHLVDQSSIMLDQAKKIFSHMFPSQEISASSSLGNIKAETLLFFGNSLNEITLNELWKILEKVKPKFFAFIEPGTRDFFSKALDIRRGMGQRGYCCHFPCPSLNYSCPLEKKKEDDWCHQVIQVTHDQELERISQMAKLDRRTLPFTAHFYELNGQHETSPTHGRLIRMIKETKFSYIWELCIQDENLKNIKVELLKKGLDKKKIKKLATGVEVSFNVLKNLGDGHYRVEVLNLDSLF
ncbi:MAG: small ribosomal subunit Rsm22 family protein [Bacteriovoracaceae bacterium]